jgi:threonine dehydratase
VTPFSWLVSFFFIFFFKWTIVLEFLSQIADLDAIIIPVGGGGMISGCCIAARALKPSIHIFAAEPEDANDCYKSIIAGALIPLPAPTNTVADGLRTSLVKTNIYI